MSACIGIRNIAPFIIAPFATRKRVGTLRATARSHPVRQSGNRYENIRHTSSFIVVRGRIRCQR